MNISRNIFQKFPISAEGHRPVLLPLQRPCAVVCPPTGWPAVGHWSAQKLLPKFNITPIGVIILAADIGDWFSLKNAKDCPP